MNKLALLLVLIPTLAVAQTTGNPVTNPPTLWPSVISYASFSSIATPATQSDITFELSKIDAGHGVDTLSVIVPQSNTIYGVHYEVLQAIGSGYTPFDNSPDVIAATAYFTAQGWDPENLWLHYSDDTTALDRCGQTWNVPGFGSGTAPNLAAARVRACGGYIYNHQRADVRQWLAYHYTQQDLTPPATPASWPLYRGIFIDSMGDLTDLTSNGVVEIPVQSVGGHIIEYSNQQVTTFAPAGTYSTAVIGAEAAITSAMHTAFPGSLLLLNLSGCITSNCLTQAQTTDGYLSEFYFAEDSRFSAGYPPFIDFAKSVTASNKVFIWNEAYDYNTVPPVTDFTASNYPSAIERHRMFSLAGYWLAQQGRYTWLEQRPIGQQLSTFWINAQQRDIGLPTADYSVWQTGTDTSGAAYQILKRPFSSGVIVLMRSNAGAPTQSDYGIPSSSYSLGGNYQILYSGGSLGPSISSIALCLGEAVVLVPAGTTTLTISPTTANIPDLGTQQFSASITGSTWAVSSGCASTISSTGFFTSTSSPETCGVTATNGTQNANATINVIQFAVAPVSVTIQVGAQQQFTANFPGSFAVTSGSCTSTSAGFLTAAASPGSCVLAATATNGGATATSTISVVPAPDTNPGGKQKGGKGKWKVFH